MLPLPLDFDIAIKEVPYVRLVAPGETIQGRVEFSRPAREYNPFYGPATTNDASSLSLVARQRRRS